MVMNREEIKDFLGGKFLKALGYLQGLGILMFIVSVFILIWHTWSLDWKVGLSGIVLALIVKVVYSITNNILDETVDKFIKEQSSK